MFLFPEQLDAVSPATLRTHAKAQTCQTQTVAGNPSLLYHVAENTAGELDRPTIGRNSDIPNLTSRNVRRDRASMRS